MVDIDIYGYLPFKVGNPGWNLHKNGDLGMVSWVIIDSIYIDS